MAGSLPLMGAGPSAGAAPVFSPSDISGLKLWLKPETLSALANNDPITTWPDSSGLGNDATATGSERPTYKTNQINGFAAADFDGNDHMASNLSMATKPFSAFVVCQVTDAADRVIMGPAGASAGMAWRARDSSGHQEIRKSGTAIIGSSTGTISNGTPHRLTVTYSGAGAYAFYTGSSADGSGTNDQTFAASTLFLGKEDTAFFLGLIGELIFYDSVLSSTDRGNVDTYLSGKFAL